MTASFTPGDLTFTGDLSPLGVDVELAVHPTTNELLWRQDNGQFTNNLNTAGIPQTYVMSPPGTVPVDPINVTIDLGDGNDSIQFDLDAWTGFKEVTVVDGGDYDFDTVNIVSGLDLLPAGGELNIQAEETTVSTGVLVAASEGISIAGTGHDALIEIAENATLSARTIMPGGDHHLDASVADSGSIKLTSKTITVADGAGVIADVEFNSPFTAGDIEMSVSEDLPTSVELYDLLNDIATGTASLPEAFNIFTQSASATIDIGAADIRASTIQMDARVDSDTVIPTISDIQDAVLNGGGVLLSLQMISDYLSGELTEFLSATGVFAAWYVKEVTTSVVRIGDNANLDADLDIVLSATTKSKESNVVDNNIQAFAVTEVESNSKVTIGEGASLHAGNDILITTDAAIESSAKAKTAKNLGLQVGPDRTAIAVAIAKSFLHSNINVAENAVIRSGADLTLHAKGEQVVSADAGAGVHVAGGLGITFAVALPTADVTTDVHGWLRSDSGTDADTGIIIHAELDTTEQSVAMSGLGGAQSPATNSTLSQPVQNFLNVYVLPVVNAIFLNTVGSLVGSQLDLSTSTAVIESNNNVDATVHGDATVGSMLDLNVESNLIARVRTFAESVVDQDPSVTAVGDVVSIASAVGDFNNQSTATVHEGAVLDASRELYVQATSEFPHHDPLVIEEDGGTRIIEIEGNSWARSHSTNGESDFGGSVTFQDYDTLTTAVIGDGVAVNQSTPYFSPDQSVSVTADSDLYTLDIAGLFELVIDVSAITNTSSFQQAFLTGGLPALLAAVTNAATTSWNDSDLDFGAGSEKTGVGGSYAHVKIENETTASVGDEVILNTGTDGQLIVDADSRVHQFSFAMSGIEAGKFGIAGSWAHNQHENFTTASIGVGTEIVAGAISVTSDSELLGMGFGGGVLQAGNYGFGVSVASNNVDRQTNAYIGSLVNGGPGGSILSVGDVLVSANNQGGVYGFALSGARQDTQLNPVINPQGTNSIPAPVPPTNGYFGIGFSGDAAANIATNHANAFVNDTGVIEAERLTVTATDNTSIVAAAGSVTLAADERSWGIAGSFAYNDVDGSALAWIRDAQVVTGTGGLHIVAERTDESGVWAATGSAAVSKGSFAGAINVSLNYSKWMTKANLYDASILSGMDAELLARDDSKTVSIAAAAAWGAKYGLGGSFAFNSMKGTAEAAVSGSDLDLQRSLVLESSKNTQIVSAAGSYGGAEKFAFVANVAVNDLDNKVVASLSNSTVNANGDVQIEAFDTSRILSVSGAVAAYEGSGFGGAIALNQLRQRVHAGSVDSEVASGGKILLNSIADGEVLAFAVGVAGQEIVGIGGSTAINRLDSVVDSHLNGGQFDATTDVVVSAASTTLIESYTGGFAGAGKVAVGVAISLNEISADVMARVTDSYVATTTGVVRVSSKSSSKMQSLAVGGAGAGDSGAIGGGFATNDIRSDVDTVVSGSTVDAESAVELLAQNNDQIVSLTGGGAGAKVFAVGAGVSLNDIDASVQALVSDSNVTSGEDLLVTTRSASTIKALAIGGAGAQVFALGGGVATNDIRSEVDAHVLTSTIDAASDVALLAENRDQISVLTGGGAGAKSVGIGAGVSLNEIVANVQAHVSDSQVTTGEDVSVTARSASTIKALAIGGAGAQLFAIGGGVATNDIRSEVDAHVLTSTIDAASDLALLAENQDQISVLAGGGAGAKVFAVGAGVSLNEIDASVQALVSDSNVTSGEDLSVTARSASIIKALAIGGAGAQLFALGGGVATNDIHSEVDAHVLTSTIDAASDLGLLAENQDQISVITGGGAGAMAFAVGAAVSLNEIESNVKAHVSDSQVTTGSDVSVTARSASTIMALAIGGAGAQLFALGGGIATNEIHSDIDAHVMGASINSGLYVGVLAENDDQIRVLTGGVAVAGGFGIGAGVSLNEIESNLRACVIDSQVVSGEDVSVAARNSSSIEALAIGGAGAGTFALGGSVSVNRIGGMICSCIMDDSDVLAAGNVSVTTFDASQIHVIAPGVAGSGAIAVGIAVVDNDINRTLKAVISDSNVDAGEDVIVDVTSRSGQSAIAVGGSISSLVAAGVSSSSNRVTQETVAAVDGTSVVDADGDVVIRATANQSIENHVYAVAASGKAAIAGAIASNHIDAVTKARVGSGVSVNAQGNISIEGVDDTTIQSTAGELAVGVAIAGLGASVSTVQVHKDVQAYIDQGADVYSAAANPGSINAYSGEHDANGYFLLEEIRGIEVQATSNEHVMSAAFGVDGSLLFGVGAGVTVTVVVPHVEAWIGSEATVDADSGGTPSANGEKAPTNVNVSAVNQSNIDDQAWGVGVGEVSIAGAADIGRIQHFVWGHIDSGAEVKALYDIDVHGLSQKRLATDAISFGVGGPVGVRGSASVWSIGSEFNSEFMLSGTVVDIMHPGGNAVVQIVSDVVDFVDGRLNDWFGGGTQCSHDIHSGLLAEGRPTGVIATIEQNAILTAGDDIDVRAREWMDVDAVTGGANIAIGVSIGGAGAIINAHSNTDAGVFGHLNAGDVTRVQATLEESTETKSLGGTVGVLAGSLAVGIVNESSEQKARIAEGGWIESTDRLLVEADENLKINIQTGEVNAGLVAAGGTVAEIRDTGLTEAYLGNANVGPALDSGSPHVCDPGLSQVRLAAVRTNVDHEFSTSAFALAAGLFSLAATVSDVDDQHQMKSWVGEDATVVLTEDLLIGSVSELVGDARLTGIDLGIVVVSLPELRSNVAPVIETYIAAAHVCVGSDVHLEVDNNNTAFAEQVSVNLGGLVYDEFDAEAYATPDVRTWLAGRESTVHAAGDVMLESLVDQNAVVEVTRGTVSLVDVGTLNAIADTSGGLSTWVGQSAELQVGNDLVIRSTMVGDSAVDVVAGTISIASVYDNNATADASFDADARLGAVGAVWVAGDTVVESTTEKVADARVGLGAIGGYTGGHANVSSVAHGTNNASVVGRIDATSDLIVNAFESNRTVTEAVSTGLSLVGNTSLESHTTANPSVSASIASDVHASGNVGIFADADIDTYATGATRGFKLVALGETNVSANTEPMVNAELKGPAKIYAAGNVTLHADQTTESAFTGLPTVSGEGATIGALVSAGGMDLRATSTPRVRASVNEGAAVVMTENLVLQAVSHDDISVLDLAMGGGFISKGQVTGAALCNGVITSEFFGVVGNVGDVTLNAESDSVANTTVVVGVAGGVVIGGADGSAGVEPAVNSTLGADLNVTGDVQVKSASLGDANATVVQQSVGLFVSGDFHANAFVSPTVDAVIAPGTFVSTPHGSIDVAATHNMTDAGVLVPLGARAVATGVAGAVLTDIGVISTADSQPHVSSRAESLSRLVAGQNLSVRARSYSDAVAFADGMAVGAGGDGSVTAFADALGTVDAVLDGVDFVRVANGDIEILAQSRNDADASAFAAGGGAIAYVNAANAVATSAPDVDARVEAESGIRAGLDVRIKSLGAGDVRAEAEEKSKGGFYNKGAVAATGTYRPTVESLVSPGTDLTAGNNFELLAYGNALETSEVYDTDRSVTVSSLSRGSALAVGRESRSDAEVDAVVTALLGEGSNVQAGNDVLINARSFTLVDVDAFTRLFGLIGSAWADSYDVIMVSTRTGSQDPFSASGFTLTAGNDVDVISDSRVKTELEAEAGALAFGPISTPVADSDVEVYTFAILGNGTTTVAGNDIYVYANKDLYQTTTTTVFGIGTGAGNADYHAETDAIADGSSTQTALTAPTVTFDTNDPVISKVKVKVVDKNISDEDWDQAVKEGLIGAEATVSGDVLLVSGIGERVTVNADKVRIINTLQKLDTSAEAELKTRRKHNIELVESEELKLEIHTQLGDDAEINRQLHTDPENAIGYRAEIKKNKKGKVSVKEKFREFGGQRGKGKGTAASTDFETKNYKRKKDEENVDLFFGLLGRNVNGYGS